MASPWLNKVERNVRRTGQVLGVAHTAYQLGKGLWAAGQAIAPYAALML